MDLKKDKENNEVEQKKDQQENKEDLAQKIDGVLRSLQSITEVLARHDNAINAILADLQTKNPVAQTQIQPQLTQSQQQIQSQQKNALGIDNNLLSNLLPILLQKFLAPESNNLGQMFQEFIVRDFFENYQQAKLQQKANLNLLLKKGLIDETDYKQVSENMNILNDPINDTIKKMRGKK